jgi:hypothetical protein
MFLEILARLCYLRAADGSNRLTLTYSLTYSIGIFLFETGRIAGLQS